LNICHDQSPSLGISSDLRGPVLPQRMDRSQRVTVGLSLDLPVPGSGWLLPVLHHPGSGERTFNADCARHWSLIGERIRVESDLSTPKL
jgi:hypothetical protein